MNALAEGTAVNEVQDDLTILSRRALDKVVKNEGHEIADVRNLTTDELRDAIRASRQAKGMTTLTLAAFNESLPKQATSDDAGASDAGPASEPWKLVLNVLPIRSLGHDAFVSAVKYRDLDKINVDADVQRPESKRRIPTIAAYVAEGDGYMPSVILTVSGADGSVMLVDGELIVESTAHVVVNDGQHRIAGIRKAIADGSVDEERMDDDLPVIVYVDLDQRQQRQLFADVNLHAVKPPKAIGLNFDDRQLLVRFAKELVEKSAAFRGKVSFVKTKVGAKDHETFTFAIIADAVKAMFDDLSPETYDAHLAEAVAFWNAMDEALGKAWDAKATNIAHTKNSMLALARLYGFVVDYDALAALDWTDGGELAGIASAAGGTNAAVKALADELERKVVKVDAGEEGE